MPSSQDPIYGDHGAILMPGRIRLDSRRAGTKDCPHCGTTPPLAHEGGCIVPKMRVTSGNPKPPAATLTQWRQTCLRAFPEQSHDGFCTPAGKSGRRKR
jgi:hypothetical protein